MKLKEKLKSNKTIYNSYKKIKNTIMNSKLEKRLKGKYVFENRSEDKNTVCIILAGYKQFVWEVVFNRIKRYAKKDIDICIVSSGVYSEKLSEIAKNNNWSYISTERNCVTLAQNIAINLFKKAKYIFKLDEDIFVTKNFFSELENTYEKVNKDGDYEVGIVAPLIPVNGYGNVIVLKKLNLTNEYEKRFEKPKYVASPNRMIESNSDAAKFMWGEGNFVPKIDDIDKKFSEMPFAYSASPIRFSIGAIYFPRTFWEEMGYFEVNKGSCMGRDEIQICSYCMCKSKAIVVSENTCVGHLSFGKQNKEMEKYFKHNIERFK